MTDRFRSVALALRDYVTNTYDLLNAADAVVALDHTIPQERPTIKTPDGKATWDWTYNRWTFTHDDLVTRALDMPEVMQPMAEGKKINAIKALRQAAFCGLKEAKEACEDQRVVSAAADPWGRWQQPPF
jgi:hypothetical protein